MVTKRFVTIFLLIGLVMTSQPVQAMPTGNPSTAPAVPQAGTYYVDAVNGNNTTGNGSAAAPWKTITYALSQAVNGDVIIIAPGLYDTALGEAFPLTLKPDLSLVGSGRDLTILSGTSSNPVVSIGDGASDFSAATRVSDLTVQNGSDGLSLYSTQGHIASPTLLNLRVKGNAFGIAMRTSNVYQYGATVSPLISNTEAIANSQNGIYIASYGYFSAANIAPEIVNCLIANNGSHGINLGASAVSYNGTSANPHIVGTVVQNNGGHGIWSSGAYEGWVNPQIERSRIDNNAGYGFAWAQGANRGNIAAAITNTMITRNQSGGIYLGDVSPYAGGGGALRLVNVTIGENANYGIYWSNGNGRVQPDVVNSIIWNTAADDLYATTSTPWSTTEIRYSDIQDGDLNGQSGNFSSDPALDETYHLTPCSPAIDAGTLSGAPAFDIDGDPRPQGSAPDVGADELGTPCLLRTSKSVSTNQARYGDTLTYTLRVTNITPVTTVNILLTDTLPAAISYVPGTLVASEGTTGYQTAEVTWAGALVPSDTVTISLAAKVIYGNVTVQNRFTADAIGYGTFTSQAATTQVAPLTCYLPLLYRKYCGGPFIDNFSNPASGWPSADTAYWVYGYLNGEYRFSAKRSAFGAVTRGDRSDNLILEVDARQASAVNGSFGLMFYLNDDWSNFYTFEIYPATQEYAIFSYLNGQWSFVTYGSTGAIYAGQSTNRLRITSQSNQYSFWINNNALGSWYFGTEARRVGLTATSDATGFEARFDNYKFVANGCPEYSARTTASQAPNDMEKSFDDRLPAPWRTRLQGGYVPLPRVDQAGTPPGKLNR